MDSKLSLPPLLTGPIEGELELILSSASTIPPLQKEQLLEFQATWWGDSTPFILRLHTGISSGTAKASFVIRCDLASFKEYLKDAECLRFSVCVVSDVDKKQSSVIPQSCRIQGTPRHRVIEEKRTKWEVGEIVGYVNAVDLKLNFRGEYVAECAIVNIFGHHRGFVTIAMISMEKNLLHSSSALSHKLPSKMSVQSSKEDQSKKYESTSTSLFTSDISHDFQNKKDLGARDISTVKHNNIRHSPVKYKPAEHSEVLSKCSQLTCSPSNINQHSEKPFTGVVVNSPKSTEAVEVVPPPQPRPSSASSDSVFSSDESVLSYLKQLDPVALIECGALNKKDLPRFLKLMKDCTLDESDSMSVLEELLSNSQSSNVPSHFINEIEVNDGFQNLQSLSAHKEDIHSHNSHNISNINPTYRSESSQDALTNFNRKTIAASSNTAALHEQKSVSKIAENPQTSKHSNDISLVHEANKKNSRPLKYTAITADGKKIAMDGRNLERLTTDGYFKTPFSTASSAHAGMNLMSSDSEPQRLDDSITLNSIASLRSVSSTMFGSNLASDLVSQNEVKEKQKTTSCDSEQLLKDSLGTITTSKDVNDDEVPCKDIHVDALETTEPNEDNLSFASDETYTTSTINAAGSIIEDNVASKHSSPGSLLVVEAGDLNLTGISRSPSHNLKGVRDRSNVCVLTTIRVRCPHQEEPEVVTLASRHLKEGKKVQYNAVEVFSLTGLTSPEQLQTATLTIRVHKRVLGQRESEELCHASLTLWQVYRLPYGNVTLSLSPCIPSPLPAPTHPIFVKQQNYDSPIKYCAQSFRIGRGAKENSKFEVPRTKRSKARRSLLEKPPVTGEMRLFLKLFLNEQYVDQLKHCILDNPSVMSTIIAESSQHNDPELTPSQNSIKLPPSECGYSVRNAWDDVVVGQASLKSDDSTQKFQKADNKSGNCSSSQSTLTQGSKVLQSTHNNQTSQSCFSTQNSDIQATNKLTGSARNNYVSKLPIKKSVEPAEINRKGLSPSSARSSSMVYSDKNIRYPFNSSNSHNSLYNDNLHSLPNSARSESVTSSHRCVSDVSCQTQQDSVTPTTASLSVLSTDLPVDPSVSFIQTLNQKFHGQREYLMRMHVELLQARDLPLVNNVLSGVFGEPSAYVKATVFGSELESVTRDNTSCPHWNTAQDIIVSSFDLNKADACVIVKVYHRSALLPHPIIGCLALRPPSPFWPGQVSLCGWYPLLDLRGQLAGHIKLSLTIVESLASPNSLSDQRCSQVFSDTSMPSSARSSCLNPYQSPEGQQQRSQFSKVITSGANSCIDDNHNSPDVVHMDNLMSCTERRDSIDVPTREHVLDDFFLLPPPTLYADSDQGSSINTPATFVNQSQSQVEAQLQLYSDLYLIASNRVDSDRTSSCPPRNNSFSASLPLPGARIDESQSPVPMPLSLVTQSFSSSECFDTSSQMSLNNENNNLNAPTTPSSSCLKTVDSPRCPGKKVKFADHIHLQSPPVDKNKEVSSYPLIDLECDSLESNKENNLNIAQDDKQAQVVNPQAALKHILDSFSWMNFSGDSVSCVVENKFAKPSDSVTVNNKPPAVSGPQSKVQLNLPSMRRIAANFTGPLKHK